MKKQTDRQTIKTELRREKSRYNMYDKFNEYLYTKVLDWYCIPEHRGGNTFNLYTDRIMRQVKEEDYSKTYRSYKNEEEECNCCECTECKQSFKRHGFTNTGLVFYDFPVFVSKKTKLVEIGCQIHKFSYWQENWRKIAYENGYPCSEDEKDEIMSVLRCFIADETKPLTHRMKM